MTQQEFMERTGITPTAEDFDYIHAVYLNTSMNMITGRRTDNTMLSIVNTIIIG